MDYWQFVSMVAIILPTAACVVLWIGLTRIKAESQARNAEIIAKDKELRRLRAMDSDQLAKQLLRKLPTLPKHKQKVIKTFVREHQPMYERRVHID